GYRARRSLAREPCLEPPARLRPGLDGDRVPGRVAPLAAADDHVPTVDTLELGGNRRQCRAGALVQRVGLELDAQAAELLERVSQEQVLRLGVRARAPGGRVQPGVADLEAPVLGRERHVAGR